MKKIFTAVLVGAMMLCGSQAFAQIGVGAGYKNISHKVGSNDPSSLNGAYVQVDYNIPIVGGLSIVPGVNYTYAYNKNSETLFDGEMTEQYLEIPVRLNLGVDLSDNIRGFVFAGPAFDYGLSSQIKISAGSLSTTTKLYDNDNSDYKRLNVMLGGGAGVSIMDVVRVTVGYDCGLTNRYNSDVKWKTNQLYAGVSLLF